MHTEYDVNKKTKKQIKIVGISLQVMVGKPYLTKDETEYSTAHERTQHEMVILDFRTEQQDPTNHNISLAKSRAVVS